jgi:hypothetical protein
MLFVGLLAWLDQDARSTLTTLNRGSRVYVDVQDQAVRPSGECAKVGHGFCGYSDTAFDLDSHVVAVAEEKLSHILNCVGWVPHVS